MLLYRELSIGIVPFIRDYKNYIFKIDFDTIQDTSNDYELSFSFCADIETPDGTVKADMSMYIDKEVFEETILNRKAYVYGNKLLITNMSYIQEISESTFEFLTNIQYIREIEYGVYIKYYG